MIIKNIIILRCNARLKVEHKIKHCKVVENHNHLPMVEIDTTTVDVSDEIEQVNTNRGGYLILHQKKKFIRCSQNKEIIHFRCQNYTTKCKCRIALVNGKARMSNNHNHD